MGQGSNFNKGFLVGFFAGGAFGAALALLFAPKSGKELRQDKLSLRLRTPLC